MINAILYAFLAYFALRAVLALSFILVKALADEYGAQRSRTERVHSWWVAGVNRAFWTAILLSIFLPLMHFLVELARRK